MGIKPYEFNDFCKWLQEERQSIMQPKVYLITNRTICKHMTTENFIRMVKGYIQLVGGQHIEFNSDYSKVRIYGKRESFLNYKNDHCTATAKIDGNREEKKEATKSGKKIS